MLSEDADELSLVVSLFVLSLLSVAELSVKLLSFLLSVAELVFCDEQAEADVRIDAQASIAAVNLIFSFIVCPFFMRGYFYIARKCKFLSYCSISHYRVKFKDFHLSFSRRNIIFTVNVTGYDYSAGEGIFALHIIVIIAWGYYSCGLYYIGSCLAEYIVRKENAVCTHNEIGLESAAFKLIEPCVCAVPQRAAIIVKIRNIGGGAVFGCKLIGRFPACDVSFELCYAFSDFCKLFSDSFMPKSNTICKS